MSHQMGIKQQIDLKHSFISRLVIVDKNAIKIKTAEKVLNFQNIGLHFLKRNLIFFLFLSSRQNA